jgi:hypothetical protein
LLNALGAGFSQRSVREPQRVQATEARLARGTITLLPRSQRVIADRPIIGAVLLTRDLARVEALTRKAGIGEARIEKAVGYRSLIYPPSATHGLWLEFRQVDSGHD